MFSGIYEIAAGLMQETERQAIIASNLSGSGISGFKGRHLVSKPFDEVLEGEGSATQANDTITDFGQGTLENTGGPLDFALNGEGFFEIELENGATVLTRNGSFKLSPDGQLTTREGYSVMGSSGPIELPANVSLSNLHVEADGTLVERKDGRSQAIDRLRVVTVEEPEKLDRITANYFVPSDDQELVEGNPQDVSVVGRAVERANVSPVREMAAMIQSVREFEMGHRVLKMVNEISAQEQQKLG